MADIQVYRDEDAIEDINDTYWQLRAEAVPEDQLDMPEQDQLLYVYHCTPEPQSSQVRSHCSCSVVADQHIVLCLQQLQKCWQAVSSR